MGQESLKKEEHLFLYLVNTFKTSAMVALGKMENPMTNELQINLKQASYYVCLLYTSPSPRDRQKSRMPSSA